MSFKNWLYKKGANPQQSLLKLFAGFVVFMPGAFLLVSDYYFLWWARIAGYLLVAIGFYLGIQGWLGVVANRVSLFINMPGGRFSDKDTKEHQD